MDRCAEKLILGEGNVTTAGASDLEHVNSIAREMVYRCGFSKRLGPVALMDNEEVYINKGQSRSIANIGTELAAIALTEVEEVQLLAILCCTLTWGMLAKIFFMSLAILCLLQLADSGKCTVRCAFDHQAHESSVGLAATQCLLEEKQPCPPFAHALRFLVDMAAAQTVYSLAQSH